MAKLLRKFTFSDTGTTIKIMSIGPANKSEEELDPITASRSYLQVSLRDYFSGCLACVVAPGYKMTSFRPTPRQALKELRLKIKRDKDPDFREAHDRIIGPKSYE